MTEPRIEQYMTPVPFYTSPAEPLAHAARTMRLKGVRHLPVLDARGRLVGLLSERDVLWAERFEPESGIVADAMTREVYTVTPDEAVRPVAQRMAARKYGSAVVVDQGRVVGVFTTVDALRALADVLAALPQQPAAS